MKGGRGRWVEITKGVEFLIEQFKVHRKLIR